MYLKSLEVQGFKSFANKIVFEFHNGITGIVGPNGSGKSNVGDAVRWVLGEQSAKQLRGGSMQDVIFSGTESRKPLGYAYVAITLDNSDHQLPIDFEEVTVSRRVYRSGESEYLINGSSCRLKDINEMFYDTGIGKEGYSIIGQGQIDKILSGKPEERRELFDEAAGIVKFKRRKVTAQKKLEAEKQNLVRVKDILSEMDKQLAPLERQAETAKVYLKKKEELKQYDANLFLLEADRIREQLNAVEEKKKISAADLEGTTREYESIKAEYDRLSEDIEVLDVQIEDARDASGQSRLQSQELEGKINVLKEQINTSRLNEEHYTNRLAVIDQDAAERISQLEQLEDEKRKLDEELAKVENGSNREQEELEQLQEQIRICGENIESGKAQIIEILNQRVSTRGKMQRYDTMLEQIQIRKAELTQRILRLKSDESELEETRLVQEEQLKSVVAAIEELGRESQEIETRINQIQQELIRKNQQLEIGQTTYHREESRLESLRNITERYDGYGNSIRRVMSQKEREPGILGVVADIVKTEKDYELAIETALGGSIQNIVTKDEHVAKRMIEFLKKNKYGRATFLPLTSVGGRGGISNPRVMDEEGVVGLAANLVQADPRFDNVIQYLLGRILIVDHIDHAIAIARKYKYAFRIVTLEGDSLSPGGSMAGGAYKNSGNLLGRRREIEELEESVGLLKKDMLAMQQSVDEQRNERSALRKDLAAISEKLHARYLEQNTAKMNLDQTASKRQETQSGYGDLHTESREIESQIREISEKKQEIQAQVDESVTTEKDMEQQISQWQSALEAAREAEEKQLKVSEAAHLQVLGLTQKIGFIKENIQRIYQELRKLDDEKQEISGNAANIEQEIKERETEIESLRGRVEELQQAGADSQQILTEKQQKREELSAKYKTFFGKQEELSKHMNLVDKELLRLENQGEKLMESRDQYINYMWEEYEMTGSMAVELRDEELGNAAALKKLIAGCKDEIRKLGDVNVNAIEDYRSLAERHEFLLTQHDDLVEAEETLIKIIEELDEGMRAQFKEKFTAIQVEFDKAFKQLFGGGKGTLELMEEEDILEAGIKIISQPPGKKLQNMMQLSGGEKALTAIALLFAIQNLKPSPFCLLDEIEAALDDSNVSRYANYLNKLTKNTQFIIITHRRGTMAAADRLYGITMQEKGISTLVSVSLIENDLDK